ncbi:dimethyl sulfoxide reductase anchor subunit [Pseudolysobacter antarcticus]|uniref:Dimethyl sulfoxide reductase anchor subunit n=1 Tax=Pseudolysobacter antarcticus TaxID=2511995 RepID=A0A411HNS0_9GAMM|nr:DmsC/YnfH family molybdoenzyme membrane anchor subunit [Pseudolysobacter antarcticus]QBB72133.1 dimethyl sulfoxide reductase anchor subunit [Pseudolysobacter antarcticus]
MHPALSVIFFTTASGAGYGLLFLLALACAINPAALSLHESLTMLALGLLFGSAGLLSSMLHLGHPERAWRAFSQWRSSWLSREGVVASFTYLPALLLGVLLSRNDTSITLRICAILLATCAVATVFCTARIYSSLKTIHAWHNGYVLPAYLLFALLSGASWNIAVCAWFSSALSVPALLTTMLLLLVSALLKLGYWHFIDTTRSASSAETATGLGQFGQVSSFERPHTEQNYLLKEMGFLLARKHAQRLRRLVLLLFAATFILLGVLLAISASLLASVLSTLAAITVSVGLLVERWLFFAEAKHLVTLYYDTRRR